MAPERGERRQQKDIVLLAIVDAEPESSSEGSDDDKSGKPFVFPAEMFLREAEEHAVAMVAAGLEVESHGGSSTSSSAS